MNPTLHRDTLPVTVIIPNNRRPALTDAVRSILASRGAPAFEIIVAGETDSANRTEDPRVRYLDLPALSTGALRNRAAALARGEVLLFTDSDCIAAADWLANATRACRPAQPVVGGGIRFPESNRWDLGDNLAIFHGSHVSRRAGPAPRHLGTNNLAVRRDFFIRLGGFRDDLTVGEDGEFLSRVRAAGVLPRFDPSFAVLHNSGRATALDVRRHAEWYGRGYAELLRARHIRASPVRAEFLLGRAPLLREAWCALQATLQTGSVYAAHPAFLRYAGAAPAVWLFYFARRRAVMNACAAGQAAEARDGSATHKAKR